MRFTKKLLTLQLHWCYNFSYSLAGCCLRLTSNSIGAVYCVYLDYLWLKTSVASIYETDVLSQAINNHCGDKEIQVWHLHWITYWKSPFYRIAPLEKYRPPIILRVGTGKFTDYRNLLSDKHDLITPRECIIHHLSYASPNYLIRRKINSVSASLLINSGWYQDVWLKWDQDHSLKNLHPVTPREFQQAQLIKQEYYPTVLEDLLEKYTPSTPIVDSAIHTKEFFRNLYTGEFPEMLQELSEDK